MGSSGPPASKLRLSDHDPFQNLPPEITYQILQHLYHLLPLSRLCTVEGVCRLFRSSLLQIILDNRFPREYYVEEPLDDGDHDAVDGAASMTDGNSEDSFAHRLPPRTVETKASADSSTITFEKLIRMRVRKAKIENSDPRVNRVFYMLELPLPPEHSDPLMRQVKLKNIYVSHIFGTSSWISNVVPGTPLWDEPVSNHSFDTIMLEVSKLVGRVKGSVLLKIHKRPVEKTVLVEDLVMGLVHWCEGLEDGDADVLSRIENRMFRGLRWLEDNVFEVETRINLLYL